MVTFPNVFFGLFLFWLFSELFKNLLLRSHMNKFVVVVLSVSVCVRFKLLAYVTFLLIVHLLLFSVAVFNCCCCFVCCCCCCCCFLFVCFVSLFVCCCCCFFWGGCCCCFFITSLLYFFSLFPCLYNKLNTQRVFYAVWCSWQTTISCPKISLYFNNNK